MGDCGSRCATEWCGSIQQLTLKNGQCRLRSPSSRFLPTTNSTRPALTFRYHPPHPHPRFPAHTSSVQNNYTAGSLSDPEAIRVRYKLQETDKNWHEAAAATPATYPNLSPGSYHFSVEAPDTNGVWSGAPANMAFTIRPAFYQTTWFRLLCVAAFLAFLWGLHQLRLHQLRGEDKTLREAIETIPAMA